MVTVVNKYKHKPTDHDVYIGRGSVFGNPFSHLDSSIAEFKTDTREEAIESFKRYFEMAMNSPKGRFESFKTGMQELYDRAKKEDLNLVCFCKPKACHGDVIKEWLDKKLDENGKE